MLDWFKTGTTRVAQNSVRFIPGVTVVSRFRPSTLRVLVAGVVLLCPPAVSAQQHGRESDRPADSMIVSRDWLAQHLRDSRVVLLFITYPPEDSSYAQGHIPGAQLLDYRDIQTERDGLYTELPAPDTLRNLFERLGVSDDSRVVLYGPPPQAARAYLTLEYLGHARTSILDGNLASWRADGRPVATEIPSARRGHLTPHPHPDIVVGADWITSRLGSRGLSLIDTRTDGEYLGTGGRHGIPSAGHIAGARQLQWEQLFSDPASGVFLPRDQLAALYAARVAPGDTVVTYCWVGQRASLTYFVARLLGYPARLYDGSYQDWSKRNLPVRNGSAP
jgi:thiosulfate/3-mercaptopyruvate sulfurtransferase